jgi:hypothetical protein
MSGLAKARLLVVLLLLGWLFSVLYALLYMGVR